MPCLYILLSLPVEGASTPTQPPAEVANVDSKCKPQSEASTSTSVWFEPSLRVLSGFAGLWSYGSDPAHKTQSVYKTHCIQRLSAP
eukprot:3605046-Amphidinium_carterae.1